MRNMVETNNNMVEDIDGGNFFDQIDDLLEFPTDDVDTGIFGPGVVDCTGFPPIWSEDSPGFSDCHSHSASDLSAELSVPYEDIVQLEWLSTFVEDSFSGGGSTLEETQKACSDNKDAFRNQFQTSSPVSVLDSSTTSNFSRPKTLPVSHEKRARSKRPRPATFNPRAAIQLIAPSQPAPVTSNKDVDQQNKKMKIKILPPVSKTTGSGSLNAAPVRKCKHCEITETPQWRSGPMGPKTLCNACGVRYNSGRLYPEYRPAASPTFVPSLHSNSHKKVLDMREQRQRF